MQYLNVSGFWKPSVKSNIFVYFHQHSIGNRNIKVRSRLHLELVHGLPGLGDIQLIVLAVHNETLLLTFFRAESPFHPECSFSQPIHSFAKRIRSIPDNPWRFLFHFASKNAFPFFSLDVKLQFAAKILMQVTVGEAISLLRGTR